MSPAPNPSQPPIYELPDDVLSEIAEYVRQNAIATESFHMLITHEPTSLDNCCFVSKRFNDIFLPMLYKTISISPHWDPRKGAVIAPSTLLRNAALLFKRQPRAGSWVRELHIHIDEEVTAMLLGDSAYSDLVALLRNTTGLISLHLVGMTSLTWGLIHPDIQSALRHRCLTLEQIVVETRLVPPTITLSSPSLFSLTLVGTQLERDELERASQSSDWTAESLDASRAPMLYSFTCHNDWDILPVYRQVCPSAFEALRSLVLSRAGHFPSANQMLDLLRLAESSLESVRIDFDEFNLVPLRGPGSAPCLDFTKMENLREVSLRYACNLGRAYSLESGQDARRYEDMLVETLGTLRFGHRLEDIDIELTWLWETYEGLWEDRFEEEANSFYLRIPSFLQRLDLAWADFAQRQEQNGSLKRLHIRLFPWVGRGRLSSTEALAVEFVGRPLGDLFPTLHAANFFTYQLM
ncbi:hypothetical protein CC1G_05041 [Coprinopsis cinerea okayama7|uniref:F-box domain-containing protein n=1 Tax=Coprinopsis cinerea (strain Okayama-7 / 130 / ATCC MYA-4618 / FGSC 9003) TaxID=240176 RepID=A8NSN1_COPC7|nr:hypothetical protein CC1G_05041 [Coprinopsis cinerea okayama7\|eukprot:XP_001836048.1 hypothetical protein CC1G_05041 [Coprinopsis cinerea okayama7\